jgi:hypothetical protein
MENKTEYPKWLYHPTEKARIVPNAGAWAELGMDWAESPDAFTGSPAEPPTEPANEKPTKARRKKAE